MKAEHNGYMPFPHTFTDQVMPLVGGSEWKVFHTVTRCTLGWRKIWDEISLSQFERRTGLTRQSISTAVERLANKGFLHTRKTNRQHIEYALIYPDMEHAEELVKNINKLDWLKILTRLVKILDESYEKLVKNLDIQKKDPILKKEKKEKKPVVPTSDEDYETVTKPRIEAEILATHGLPAWSGVLREKAEKLELQLHDEFPWIQVTIEQVKYGLIKLLDYNIEDVLAVMRDKSVPGRNTDELDWVVAELEGGENG